MNTPRFNNHGSRGATPRFIPLKYPHRGWIRVSKFDRRPSPWTGSGRKRIFAIVSGPESSNDGSKRVMRVLIFDNHPDSLGLIFNGESNPPIELSPPRPLKVRYLILLAILTLSGLTAIVWPLL